MAYPKWGKRVTMTFSRSDAEFVAKVLHSSHLGMGEEEKKRAKQLGNEIAMQLTRNGATGSERVY